MASTGGTIPFNPTPEQEKRLREVIEKYKDMRGALIPVLHEAQKSSVICP